MYEYQNYIQRYCPHMMGVEPVTYPKIYYILLPMVQKKCMEMEAMSHPMMQAYPCYETVEKMSEEICDNCLMQDPDILKEYQVKSEEHETAQFFGPRRLLRDLTGILLLRELFRRRSYPYPYRQPYYPPVYGPYGY